MKKLLFSVLVLLATYTTKGQVKIGNNPTIIGASSLLELESSNKALVVTRVANTAAILSPVNGMLIHDLSSNCFKVYQNNAWSNCINTSTATATVVATCTGFIGSYCATVLSGTTYEVIFTNNDFEAKQVTPLTTDLTLSGISGVTVSAVSPSVATTVNAGASLVITYTIAGTPAAQGTLTGTFAKQGLTCSSTVAVGGAPQTVTAASSSPVTAINAAMPNVTHTTTAATGIGAATGLPTGVMAVWAANTITISGTPSVLGTFNYSIPLTGGCGIVNATGTIKVVQCGAFVGGTFKEFMCHNLGANTALNPFTYVVGNADGTGGTLGYLYQWGRQTDGHELRNSLIQAGPVAAPVANRFITVPDVSVVYDWISPQNNNLLLDGSKTANDPCPAGFRVPTQAQWGGTFRDGLTSGFPGTATRNTWTWTGNGYTVGTNLYLPAAGYRYDSNATLTNVGADGLYWSSTIQTTITYTLDINSGVVDPGNNHDRVYGMSVRCIAE